MPKISIIVPVYKTEKYLHRCIDSILSQTFADFECILINDGSPDNCPAICDEYAEKDSRIIVIHQKNAGVSAARNAGLDIAQGEWIGFADSDDWCDPDMFQVLYENAMKYDADISICSIKRKAHIRKNLKQKIKKLSSEKAIEKMFTDNNFCGYSVNKLVYSELFLKNRLQYDVKIKYMEDTMLFYELFKYANKIIYSPIQCYNIFSNPESVTSQLGLTESAKTALITLDRLIDLENNKKVKKKIIIVRILFSYGICAYYINQNDFTDENFQILRKYILTNIVDLIFDFTTPLKKKITCCLIFYPHLFRIIYSMFKSKSSVQ